MLPSRSTRDNARRLGNNVLRGGVQLGEEPADIIAGHRRYLYSSLRSRLEKFRILHRGLERLAQSRSAIGWNIRRCEERSCHALRSDYKLDDHQPLLIL